MDQTTKWLIRSACFVVLLGAVNVVLGTSESIQASRDMDQINLCKLRVNYKGYQRIGLLKDANKNMNECLSEYGLTWTTSAKERDVNPIHRAELQCQSVSRRHRQAADQRKAEADFHEYSQTIWKGSKYYQSEPRTIPLETKEECLARVLKGAK